MTIYDLPDHIRRESQKRCADTEQRMFAAGHSFEEIEEFVTIMRATDERIAVAIRDAIPHLRTLNPEAIGPYLQKVTDAACRSPLGDEPES
jgi:hypothetical protein